MRDGGLAISDRQFFWYDTEDRRTLLEARDDRLLRTFLQERLGDATADPGAAVGGKTGPGGCGRGQL